MTETYHQVPQEIFSRIITPVSGRCFGGAYLHNIHAMAPREEHTRVVTQENDNKTWWHRRFYDALNQGTFDDNLLPAYHDLIREVVAPLVGEPFCFQTKPTFRVQVPGSLSVGEFHRDLDYNHPHGEVNWILPLTTAGITNTVWTESEPGKGDFHPLVMTPGWVIQFNGSLCSHGNKTSEEHDRTRVSIDFRTLPMRLYDPGWSPTSTGHNKKFLVGDYYTEWQQQVHQEERTR